ncbi:MAG: hypothetical protein ACRD2A_24645, partial [Vicinamibacterales bacterium]
VTTKARTDEYFDHFSPDILGETYYNFIRRTYGTDADEVDSTYTFGEVRAGDDIDVGHVNTTAPFGEPRSYATTSIGGTPYGASVAADVPPDTTVNFIVGTDVDWSGQPPPDDGIEQIFLTTNGDITATELVGNMLVGHIHSTGGDVTLTSPIRILDANTEPTIDVTGDDITMTVGTLGGTSGVGLFADFLEINVDRNTALGVLTITDTAGNSGQGVFVDDLLGRMRVDSVVTEGDASLRTVEGSILQGTKNGAGGDVDLAADVVANSIDIDANGASSDIGEFTKDLDIDSSADATGDVSLEATRNMYLTETDATLRLVMAHTYTGDIRLTVRETAGASDTNEDFELLHSGSANF